MLFQALIHVSTAYSNCDRSVIDEVVYQPANDVSTVEYLKEFDNECITQHLLGNILINYTDLLLIKMRNKNKFIVILM